MASVIALIEKNKKLLIELHEKDKSMYSNALTLPGGHIEKGENEEQALIREMKEELDILPLKYKKLGTFKVIKDFNNYSYEHVFHITSFEGKIKKLSASNLFWINKNIAESMLELEPDKNAVRFLFKKGKQRALKCFGIEFKTKNVFLDFHKKYGPVTVIKGKRNIMIKSGEKPKSSGLFLAFETAKKMKSNKVYKVLDIGTGNGAVLFGIYAFADIDCYCIEKHAGPLKELKTNAEINKLRNIKIIRKDINKDINLIENKNKTFDFITSNIAQLPYNAGIIKKLRLNKESIDYNFAKSNGWQNIKSVLSLSKKILNKDGKLMLLMFSFLGTSKRTGKEKCLIELAKDNFSFRLCNSYIRKIRGNGITASALPAIAKHYPKAEFFYLTKNGIKKCYARKAYKMFSHNFPLYTKMEVWELCRR
ncbi:MAG: NUDIX domain-containing protein [Candidatus Anstonellales archaeon]